MKTSLIIAMFLLLTVLCGFKCMRPEVCDGHHSLTVKNNSQKTIHFAIYWEYPNSRDIANNPKYDGSDGIKPGDSLVRGVGRYSCWEQILNNNNDAWLFIFDQDSLNALPFEKIMIEERGLLYEKRLDLPFLMEHHFVIEYVE